MRHTLFRCAVLIGNSLVLKGLVHKIDRLLSARATRG